MTLKRLDEEVPSHAIKILAWPTELEPALGIVWTEKGNGNSALLNPASFFPDAVSVYVRVCVAKFGSLPLTRATCVPYAAFSGIVNVKLTALKNGNAA